MTERQTSYQFYGELASWWPLISPPEDYEEEAAELGGLLASAAIPVREVLELGSGGGHNASHLSSRFAVTLVDLSAEMLAVSQVLNPECRHERGDMRTIRLGREFDAVLVHDAIDYMVTESDLRAAIETAFVHCRAGGVAVFAPDTTKEAFVEHTEHGGADGEDGRSVRYLEWSWDPDPSDTCALAEYSFLLREPDGSVRAVHETHRFGLFGRDDWLRLLHEGGFDARVVTEQASEDREPRLFFVGTRTVT